MFVVFMILLRENHGTSRENQWNIYEDRCLIRTQDLRQFSGMMSVTAEFARRTKYARVFAGVSLSQTSLLSSQCASQTVISQLCRNVFVFSSTPGLEKVEDVHQTYGLYMPCLMAFDAGVDWLPTIAGEVETTETNASPCFRIRRRMGRPSSMKSSIQSRLHKGGIPKSSSLGPNWHSLGIVDSNKDGVPKSRN